MGREGGQVIRLRIDVHLTTVAKSARIVNSRSIAFPRDFFAFEIDPRLWRLRVSLICRTWTCLSGSQNPVYKSSTSTTAKKKDHEGKWPAHPMKDSNDKYRTLLGNEKGKGISSHDAVIITRNLAR